VTTYRQQTPDEGAITAILGPTNTGKTHYAVERMLSRASGIIGLPLRLLAREIYDRVCAVRGPDQVALITGEEKIQPAGARHFICTAEAMPLEINADFVAIDEIQLCADPERGHVFTDRLLHARGRYETLFLGSDNMRGRIASLVPRVRFDGRERFSTLSYSGASKISRLKPRTAVVAFSAEQVYAIAELIRRQRGGAAVVMGALSPRTRNAQVALYQNGDVDYIVATDAIGMGLNMDVDHVAFAGLTKFDGHCHRRLEPNELAQIAGRAGRYTKDGTFGVTGEAGPLDAGTVEAIENHQFKPLARLMWRNTDLDFVSVPSLIDSLELPPLVPDLMRAREADDLASLKHLWADPEIRELTNRGDRVRLLWEVCQTPDFRKTVSGDHVTLLSSIYRFLLTDTGVIPSDWIAGNVRRIDRVDGDIDALSKRLAYIRTWTYVANRGRWLDDPESWRETTREVEDRLSEALHERLTQRFVDRRTSVLMRRLKQKERLVAEVNDRGEVNVEGHFVGRIDGFRFTVDATAETEEIKTLRTASLAALQAEFSRRADKLYLSPDTELEITEQGGLMWGSDAIGRLEKGDSPLAPRVRIFVDDIAATTVAEKVERRLGHWITRRINTLFEPLLTMRDDESVTGLARGVAFQIAEAMGVVPRRQIADDIKALGQEERGQLRKHGVRFGQHNIFLPLLLKPAPTRMRLILWSLWEGFEVFAEAPPPGLVTIPALAGAPRGYYERVGYRLCGSRALRIDMLERLADLIRPMDVRGGFEATPDMLSITGCTLDQFAEIMKSLGFDGERGERPKPIRPGPAVAPVAAAPEAGAAVAEAVDAVEAPVSKACVAEAGVAETGAVAAELESAAPKVHADPAEPEPGAAPKAEPLEPASGILSVDAKIDQPGTEAAETGAAEAGAADARAGDAGGPEVEAFYTFKLRPRHQPGPGGPRRREAGNGQGGGETGGERRARFGGKPGGNSGGPGKGHAKGRPGSKGPRRDRSDHVRPDQAGAALKPGPERPRRDEKPIDPLSPFAILQQLKDK
jgi:ATP-dependent RNA helicase SUPV3L1/SUV3